MITRRLARALEAALDERNRQDHLRDEGRFDFTCADDPGLAATEKLAVLMEEVGEVAREVLNGAELVHDGEPDQSKLRAEVTQVCAIALAWLESLS